MKGILLIKQILSNAILVSEIISENIKKNINIKNNV